VAVGSMVTAGRSKRGSIRPTAELRPPYGITVIASREHQSSMSITARSVCGQMTISGTWSRLLCRLRTTSWNALPRACPAPGRLAAFAMNRASNRPTYTLPVEGNWVIAHARWCAGGRSTINALGSDRGNSMWKPNTRMLSARCTKPSQLAATVLAVPALLVGFGFAPAWAEPVPMAAQHMEKSHSRWLAVVAVTGP
jgi:hypothetical protein